MILLVRIFLAESNCYIVCCVKSSAMNSRVTDLGIIRKSSMGEAVV